MEDASAVRSKKLEQVRKLLDKANDEGVTEEEQAALFEKAADLMAVYAISEFEAQQRVDKNIRQKPERRSVRVCERDTPIKTQLVSLMGSIVHHARCRAVYSGLDNQQYASTATVIGFPSDLDYVELLYTSLLVQMYRHLEPRPNSDLSYEENLVALKEAGLKWKRIYQLLHPDDPSEITKAVGVKYTKIYTEYCKQHNRKRMYTNPTAYQRNYAEGFVQVIGDRLWEIERRQRQHGLVGSGMEVALRDEVKEVYNEAFKNTRSIQLGGRSRYDHAAYSSGKFDGSQADLGQPTVGNRKELQ